MTTQQHITESDTLRFAIRAAHQDGARHHPVGGTYQEMFWMPTAGPTAYCMHLIVHRYCAAAGQGIEVNARVLAGMLGVLLPPLRKALERAERFGALTSAGPHGCWWVHSYVPTLWPDRVARLPQPLVEEHARLFPPQVPR